MSKIRDEKIIAACKEGNLALVKQLIEPENVNVDEVSERYGILLLTPLGAACKGGHLEVVEYLVSERRADVNLETPLSMASTAEIVNFLIDKGAEIETLNTGGRHTSLQCACRADDIVIVKVLIDHGANKSVVDKYGDTLLHICITNTSKVAMFDYLVSEGLDFNLANRDGQTSFYTACMRFDLGVVQYLALKGVDINKVNVKSGLTPKEVALKALGETLKAMGCECVDDPKVLNDPDIKDYIQSFNSTISFLDTWNRKGEFVEEVGDFADELWLSDMLFQSYCSGEVMAEASD